uniref:C-factor n=1 Tax=Globodera pallida TaxID=36090 RepID=A0A183CPQ2_GLOPA
FCQEGGTLKAPDRAVYLRHFNVNVVGTVATTAAFLPLLRKTVAAAAAAANCGAVVRVVNIGGGLGCIGKVFLKPSECPYQNVAYGMSKAAMHHFSKMFSVDEPDIVSVAIHPGWIATDMGGPNAPVTLDERIPQLVKLIGTLTKADSGKLMDHEKEIEP